MFVYRSSHMTLNHTARISERIMNLKNKLSPKIKTNIEPANLEVLKYIAMISMIFDHTNLFLYGGKLPYFYEIGRLAMPLFCFTFAYALGFRAKEKNGVPIGSLATNIAVKTLSNGVLSVFLFYFLSTATSSWHPLNIMFLFSTFAFLIYYVETKPLDINRFYLSVIIFIACGALVDYFWIGLLFCFAAYYYGKTNQFWSLTLLLISALFLCWLNDNFYALFAFLFIWIASHAKLKITRVRNLFYILYPAHLIVLCTLKYLYK